MELRMFYAGAATCVIEVDRRLKIGIDPALSPTKNKIAFKSFDSVRIKEPQYDKTTFSDLDLWLITHSHLDHLDSVGAGIIDPTIPIICDKKSLHNELLADKKTISLNWEESHLFEKGGHSIELTAVPAFHGNSLLSRTMVGKVNGYLIKITAGSDSKTLYFTGDTVFHEKVLKAIPQNIDVLVANLGNVRSQTKGGPLTMNMEMFKKFESRLKPKKIIPIHIDDFSHYESSVEEVERSDFSAFPLGEWYQI